MGSRWNTPAISGKSVEVQRSQVDDLFKSLRSGDELAETEPSTCTPSEHSQTDWK
jgi:SWI/SNF-related matrix-associated actin-dependent regulator of chromatin subfamily A3